MITFAMEAIEHLYEVRRRKDQRGVDLPSDALIRAIVTRQNAIGYAMYYSRSSCCKYSRKMRKFVLALNLRFSLRFI